MKRSQIAEYFDVSLTTVQNWARNGAPMDGDLADVAGWKAGRDLAANALDVQLPNLPELVAEHTRRRMDLDSRIDLVNAWPPGTDANPNLVKVSAALGLILEQELLDLPRRIIAEAKPETLPEDVYRIVFSALDRAKADPPDSNLSTPDSSSPSPEKRRAVAPGKGTDGRGRTMNRKI